MKQEMIIKGNAEAGIRPEYKVTQTETVTREYKVIGTKSRAWFVQVMRDEENNEFFGFYNASTGKFGSFWDRSIWTMASAQIFAEDKTGVAIGTFHSVEMGDTK